MRKILVFGIATLGLTVGAFGAQASSLDEGWAPHPAIHHRQARIHRYVAPSDPGLYEGRAAMVGSPPRHILGDEGFHHPTDNGYHDPRFSLQQDDIYNGRF